MKKYISVLFLLVFIIPSVAFASWWNPFSWKIFHKKEVAPQTQINIQKNSDEKINELQKQLDDLKNEKEISTIKTTKEVVQNSQTKKYIDILSNKLIEAYSIDKTRIKFLDSSIKSETNFANGLNNLILEDNSYRNNITDPSLLKLNDFLTSLYVDGKKISESYIEMEEVSMKNEKEGIISLEKLLSGISQKEYISEGEFNELNSIYDEILKNANIKFQKSKDFAKGIYDAHVKNSDLIHKTFDAIQQKLESSYKNYSYQKIQTINNSTPAPIQLINPPKIVNCSFHKYYGVNNGGTMSCSSY
jgi:hypothetical protein